MEAPEKAMSGQPHAPPAEFLGLDDGRVVSFRWFGKGGERQQVMVYHHGFPCSSLEAGLVHAEAQALGVSVLAIDRPGLGLSTYTSDKSISSTASDVRALLDHLGIDRVIMVAISGGSPFAAACASLLPERVEALLLIAPLAPLAGQPELLHGMSPRGARILGGMGTLAGQWQTWITLHLMRALQRVPHGNLLLRVGGFSHVDQAAMTAAPAKAAQLKAAVRLGLAPGIQGAYHDLLLYGGQPAELDLSAIRCRTVVWVGTADITTPPRMAEAYAGAIPGAALRVAEGEGHISLPFFHIGDILASILEGSAGM